MSAPAVPPFLPTPEGQLQARAAVARLQAGDVILELPGEVLSLIQRLLTEVAEGHAVRVVATKPQLSTFEAAELLGVSRPFLISHLLDTGRIPHTRVGTHRRIALQDVLAYQEQQQARRAHADALSAEAQALDLY
jgi:excisionase family DNA binding protein